MLKKIAPKTDFYNKLNKQTKQNAQFSDCHPQTFLTLEYERVYLPIYKVADTPFHIQGCALSFERNRIVKCDTRTEADHNI